MIPRRMRNEAETEVPMMLPISEKRSNWVARWAAVAAVTSEVTMTMLSHDAEFSLSALNNRLGNFTVLLHSRRMA